MISAGVATSYRTWQPIPVYLGRVDIWPLPDLQIPVALVERGKSDDLKRSPGIAATISDAWAGTPRTELGRKLAEIRSSAMTRGIELVSNEEILNELGKNRQRGT